MQKLMRGKGLRAMLPALLLAGLGLAGATYWLDWDVAAATNLNINTVAGSAPPASGLTVSLQNARGIAASADGNTIYVADTGNHVIRKFTVSPAAMEIIAGAVGSAGFIDGIAGVSRLNTPSDVAINASGTDLYVADTANHRIRKIVLSTNTMTTIAGNGAPGSTDAVAGSASFNSPRGLGLDGTNIYVADTGNNKVRRFIESGVTQTLAGDTGNQAGSDGDGGAATSALLNAPQDVAVSGTRIYIADTGNHRIRFIESGNMNAYAGTGAALTTINGTTGAATSINLDSPSSLIVNSTNVYFTDTGHHRVCRVTFTNTLETIAGTGVQGYDGEGASTAKAMNVPVGIAIPSSSPGTALYVMDTGNRRLRLITNLNTISTIVSDGSAGFGGDGGPAIQAQLNGAKAVATDNAGNYYIADTDNHRIRKVTKSGSDPNTWVIQTIAGTGTASPVANDANGDGGPAAGATFNKPSGIAVDSGNNIYISDAGNNRIRRIDTAGNIDTIAGLVGANNIGSVTISNPQQMAADGVGNVYFANTNDNTIYRINGTALAKIAGISGGPADTIIADGSLAVNARFNLPQGVGVDSTGANVYLTDTNNNKVFRVVIADGKIYRVAGSPLGREGYEGDGASITSSVLRTPTDVKVDTSGNILISDRGNNRIREITVSAITNTTLTGTINTIAGNGVIGLSGDGGQAVQATLGQPYGLVANADGIYLADTGNNRIRRLTSPPNVAPSLTLQCNGGACAATLAATEGQPLSVAVTLMATDGNAGQTLTYSLRQVSPNANQTLANASLNTATGVFTYTPGFEVVTNTAGATQTIVIEFKVTDNGSPVLTDTETLNIQVTNVNQLPVVSSGTIPATVQATSGLGASLTLNGTATDADNDTLQYQWFDGASQIAGATSLTSQVVQLSIGTHNLILQVNDGKGGVVTTAAKTVNVVDTVAPVFTSVPADISVPAPAVGINTVAVTYNLPVATDAVLGACAQGNTPPAACSLVISPGDKTPGAQFPRGTTTVTFTASDGTNTTTASFRVVVGSDSSGSSNNYRLVGYAGGGTYGSAGNGGPALIAAFKRPSGVAVDASGNVYIADALARQVRRVAVADGTVSLVAGNGEKGYSGDGAQAVQARLNNPNGIALDSLGNLYIADTDNHVIRRVVLATGVITTFAGTGVAGFTDNAPAPNAQLRFPAGLAVDGGGNLYIADTRNHRVRKVAAGTNTMSTIAGSVQPGASGDGLAGTAATLDSPTGVAVTSDGSTIYIADRGNHKIRRVVSGVIGTYAGTGVPSYGGDGAVAALAGLNQPTDVAIDPDSNVVITDSGNDRIRRVGFTDNLITTIAGTGVAGNTGDGGLAKDATLDLPRYLGIDRRVGVTRGEVFISDEANIRVRRLTVVNSPPVPTTVGNQSVRKDRTLEVQLSAADADGDSVTFTIESANPLAFISITNANPSSRTAIMRVAPGGANVGVYTLQIKATDSKGISTVTTPFTVSVTENQAPMAKIAGGSNISVSTGGSSITIVMDGSQSTDPDGDPLTYAWRNVTTNTSLGTTATIAPTLASNTTHQIELTVSDGTLTNVAIQTITVNGSGGGGGATLFAVISGPTSLNSTTGAAVAATFDGLSSTGSPTSYQWVVDGGAPVSGATLNINLAVGAHSILLTVGNGASSSSTTRSLTVTNNSGGGGGGTGGPTALIAGAATETVASTSGTGAPVTLDGSGSTGNAPLSYFWQDNGVPLGTTAIITPTLSAGTHTITLTVTDGQNNTGIATKTVTVLSGTSCGGGVGLFICSGGISPAAGKISTTFDMRIDGNGFETGAAVKFSESGITATVLNVTPTSINVRVSIALNAQVSVNTSTKRIVTVLNPSGGTANTGRIFTVQSR
ncbi:MAG: REJ domain-containing protein [Blastocatellia bacterium]